MTYNIVTNYKVNQFLKQKSKYYKVNLGQSITLEDRSGDRVLNKNDQFAFVYNHHYNASILKQGSIGDITFYTDHEIREEVVALYLDREEFIHEFNYGIISEKGIDGFLGHILKISEEEYEKINSNQNEDTNSQRIGDAEKVVQNPGSVRYEDLKAFMEKQNSERLKK